ncbi:MAG: hypothetical protein KAS32_07790 [Candidatus Peribacteraceae bacterium]|nr:hypothetical protein [Candidatus Peribacteraceae bacterium]
MKRKEKIKTIRKLDIQVDDIVNVKERKGIYRVKAIANENAILTDNKGKESFHRVEDLVFSFPLEVGKRYFFTPRPGHDHLGVHIVTGINGRKFRLDSCDTTSLSLNQYLDVILIENENLALH